jgi:hypothetical protein
MPINPILEELRRTRERLLANAGGTMAGLVAKLQQEERSSDRKVLDASELPRFRSVSAGAESPITSAPPT